MIKFNDDGFTMIEMLISFAIFTVIASFLPILFHIILNMDPFEKRNYMFEWEVFVNQMRKEVERSERIEVANEKLHLNIGEDLITIERYQDVLRRRVNLEGHEVILQNIKNVQFIKDRSKITIKVRDTFGGEHETALFSFIAFEE